MNVLFVGNNIYLCYSKFNKPHTMKANLSSQIKLDRTPKRYYRPDNAFELTALTRFEKVFTEIYERCTRGL